MPRTRRYFRCVIATGQLYACEPRIVDANHEAANGRIRALPSYPRSSRREETGSPQKGRHKATALQKQPIVSSGHDNNPVRWQLLQLRVFQPPPTAVNTLS